MKHILRCTKCNKYTMSETCECGGLAVLARPPKYSPEDKYSDYRRKVKKDEWVKGGLL